MVRVLACACAAAALFIAPGCGDAEVGSIKAGDDGAAALKSKTEGRFKETAPPKPSRRKAAPADEGIETR